MWELLFDWSKSIEIGTDVLLYLIMALVGTTFFVLRLLMALFFGGGDLDAGDMDIVDSDASFGFFSLLSVLAFFMGAGWMGLSCRVDWGLGSLLSAALSAIFGFGMMAFASGLMFMARKFNTVIEVDLDSAIGRTARVYLTIPKDGRGQVQVSVSGRLKTMEAVGSGEKLAEFSSVKVVAVRDDGILVVEALS